MVDNYTRNDRADLSGMNPQQLSSYLQPRYDSDHDLNGSNLKWLIGIPLVIAVLIGSVLGWAWLVGGAL